MADDMHPIIAMFQAQAEILDAQGTESTVEDAIWKLAAWMGLAMKDLHEDDVALLCEIGGILYRDGLRRRMAQRPS